jgi:hypothetical protein
MSLNFIIKSEIEKFSKQRLTESNTYGFPEGKVDSGKVVTGGENGNWGGSMDRTLEILSIAKKCKGNENVVISQKRSKVKTASNSISDHYIGNLSAYAVDIPASGKKGDELLSCIMSKWDNGSNSEYKGGKWLSITKDGYRYQFGWKVRDHYDHIHVGVRKKGGKFVEPKSLDNSSEKLTDEKLTDTKNLKSIEKSLVGLKSMGFKEFFSNIENIFK